MSTATAPLEYRKVTGRYATVRLSRSRFYTQVSIFSVDSVALLISAVLAITVRRALGSPFEPIDYLPFLGALPIFGVMFALAGLYPGIAMNPVDELRRIAYATTAGYLIVIGGTFLRKVGPDYSRLVFLGAWFLSIITLVLARHAARHFLGSKQWWGIPIIVLGAGSGGARFVETLRRDPSLGFRPVAVLDDDTDKHRGPGPNGEPPVLGRLSLAPQLAAEYGVRYAAVAMPSVSAAEIADIIHRYAHRFPHFLLVPDFFGIASVWVTAREVGGIFGLEVQQNLIRRVPQLTKRAFDLTLVIAGGILIAPLLVLIAAAIRVTSPGPVLYFQKRTGQHGREFPVWKFRTMVRDADAVLESYLAANPEMAAEWAIKQKITNDPRITSLGKILRKTSLDELPQLWNVLTGEMSLVGPRPRPVERLDVPRDQGSVELYTAVPPGMTGLWQVSGRSNTSYEERVRLDEYYVRNWSVWLDLFVLGRTVRTVLRAEGSC